MRPRRTKRGRFAKTRKRIHRATKLRRARSCGLCKHPVQFHGAGGCKAWRGRRRCGCRRTGVKWPGGGGLTVWKNPAVGHPE